MSYRVVLTSLALVLCSFVIADAQRRQYVNIKIKPVVRFDFSCTQPSFYPKGKLARLMRPIIKRYDDNAGVWGDRAFAYDLNADKVNEYFVPFDCGATGNCTWGVFAVNPARMLGKVEGETIYVHRRVGRWSQLTVTTHESSWASLIYTYRFNNARYRRFGRRYEASAYREDFPKLLLTVEPLCNPNYKPGSVRP